MKSFQVGDELTIIVIGTVGRCAAVVTSIGDKEPPEAVESNIDRDLDGLWDSLDTKATPSNPCVKLKYDYGKGRRTFQPGEYIVYSIVEPTVRKSPLSSTLVGA